MGNSEVISCIFQASISARVDNKASANADTRKIRANLEGSCSTSVSLTQASANSSQKNRKPTSIWTSKTLLYGPDGNVFDPNATDFD